MEDKIIIESERADNYNKLSDLKALIERAEQEGATHWQILTYGVDWIQIYRIKSAEEIKAEKINELKRQLKELEG